MKKIIKTAKMIILAAAFLMCMTQARMTGEAVRDAVERCMLTVIPSLYAMMIVSALITKSGILSCLPGFPKGEGRYEIYVFLYSMFAGYPVGATMLLSETENKRLDAKTASLLSGVCFGAGPAFISGCISSTLYSSSNAGLMILVSGAAANILTALFLMPFLKQNSSVQPVKREFSLNAGMMTESIISAGKTMAGICFSITAFSVISCFLDYLGVTANAGMIISGLTGISEDRCRQLVSAFLDVTNVSGLPKNDLRLLPYISGLVSFGGVCVILQIAAITKGKINIKPLILIRTAVGFLSGMICRIIMPFFLRNEITSASTVNIRMYRDISPVPSVMLVIMTFMLFVTYGRTAKIPES